MASTTQSWAAATQSWASWLLDSYAESVSPLATDTSFHQHQESQPVSDSSYIEKYSSVPSVTTSSAYGPYVKTGRGGAGNFTWQTDLKIAPRSISPVNIEANLPQQHQPSLAERRKAAARLETINIREAMRPRQNSAQHLGVGRGVAGNPAIPNKMRPIQRSITLPTALISPTTPKPLSPKHQNSYPAVHTGRGGAGNFAAAVEASLRAETEKEQEERLAFEQRREQIIEEVDGLLQPPPGAWLGGRGKSELVFEDV